MDLEMNPGVRRDGTFAGLFSDDEYTGVREFYDGQPHLSATPLRLLPGLAAELGLGALMVKDESARFGVEAFKVLGVRYAVSRIARQDLAKGVVCATAGNHGRAVARVARELDVPCTVFVPAADRGTPLVELATRTARIVAMRHDGADVVDVAGGYEDAVSQASAHAEATGATVVSDTAWPGYEAIPRAIMAGYTRMFDEAARQWPRPPDALIVQGGVGGLVCAAASWCARHLGPERPLLIAAEPDAAACLLGSARAGRPVDLRAEPPAAPRTIMAGLRCATPSPAAWPTIAAGIDAFVSIPDALALEALDRLSKPLPGDPAVAAGPSGACGVGAALALGREPALAAIRERLGLGRSTRVLAVVTEGP